jgi:hypothetical protein
VAKVVIRAPQEADIDTLVANLRAADRAEMIAAWGSEVRRGVALSLRTSSHAWAGEIDGELAGLFGVAPGSWLGGVGIPWLLTTDAVEKAPRAFIKANRRYLARMRAAYPRLHNLVDSRHTVAVRWLEYLGFTVHRQHPVPVGAQRVPFYRFEMGVSDV